MASDESFWNADTYTQSVSSRCWWFTPYGDGWHDAIKWGGGLQNDRELREILQMELALPVVPPWARSVVEGPIQYVAPCGHHRFPLSYLDAVDAIGRQAPLPLQHTCYTVDAARKRRASDYAFCLDAWLAGANPDEASVELLARPSAPIDWPIVCRDLWAVLGERTELKRLLVERMLHNLRWYIKVTIWDDPAAAGFGQDAYLGTFKADDDFITGNGNPHLRKGCLREGTSPRIQALEDQIVRSTPHAKWFLSAITEFSWLCAPKAFRYMEKTLWCIGQEKPVIHLASYPLENEPPVPGFLQCADTIPNFDLACRWWRDFQASLQDWWQAKTSTSPLYSDIAARLGQRTPVKEWLVRLLAHRLHMLQRDSGILHKLVGGVA